MGKKVMLIIMDGLGAAPNSNGNAVSVANPKNLSQLWDTYPRTYLLASGESVGLPKGVKGNSEVGHLNIGAGTVVNQNLPRIDKAIAKDTFKTNNTLWDALKHAIKYKSKIHIMGCFSDGSVHAHINHFKATLDFFSYQNFAGDVVIHAFTDGRDTPMDKSPQFFAQIDEHIAKNGLGRIGTIVGRYLAMDRNQTWDRTAQAYNLLVNGIGEKFNNWKEAINWSYKQGKTDEFHAPIYINGPTGNNIAENDVVLFMNFRADRALQLTEAFINPNFTHFPVTRFKNLFFASIVEYRKSYPYHVLFPKEYISMPLGKIVSEHGLRQLRIAESEKFPHVTYFFNGGTSIKYQGEDRIEIPSPAVATYDLKPEMSAMELSSTLSDRIASDIYDFVLVNFANTDMVGHTGNIEASVKAVQVIDYLVADLVRKFTARGGSVIITADHGNIEELINLTTGQIDTEHSINPVPMIVIDKESTPKMLPYGSLKDISPTILALMGLPIPAEMTGRSLLSID
jgi:2,3-bisphosphoglycerate-independent phosphoglycerate mutase